MPPSGPALDLYRDDNHLSVPSTAWLAPALAAGLDAALPPSPSPPPGFAGG